MYDYDEFTKDMEWAIYNRDFALADNLRETRPDYYDRFCRESETNQINMNVLLGQD